MEDLRPVAAVKFAKKGRPVGAVKFAKNNLDLMKLRMSILVKVA